MKTIALIPGDGIGPEVVDAARSVLTASGAAIEFRPLDAGWDCFQRTGAALPSETLEALQESDAALFGAVSSPSHHVEGYHSPIVGMRRHFDLYACLRRVNAPPLQNARPADFVVVRENSEGLYSGLESRAGDRATGTRVITRRASERIARFARDLALSRPRGKVTVVHKANVLRETCGLFRERCLEVLGTAELEVEERLVDSMAYDLARDPSPFDVILTTNLFGDILSDVGSLWGGGLGLATSANVGDGFAIFEPVHGSAPDLAGRDLANPIATISSAANLLDSLGERTAAERIRDAVDGCLRDGPRTRDLGGSARGSEVTAAILYALRGASCSGEEAINAL